MHILNGSWNHNLTIHLELYREEMPIELELIG